MKRPVLVINTYGGSLLLGARQAGYPVVGAYEDAGYGTPIQLENFPKVTNIPRRQDWPHKPLKGHVVIAHPPCAAFSSMNYSNSMDKFGADAVKFQCTVDVMNYAMGLKCDALAIESVVGAYEGARRVHDVAAKRHGYDVYRVLQNSALFGVPQYRERFWCLFVRKDLHSGPLHLDPPELRSAVRDLVKAGRPVGQPIAMLERKWEEQLQRLKADFGKKVRDEVVSGEWGFGALGAVLRRRLTEVTGKTHELGAVSKRHVVWGAYQSNTPRILDPDGLVPALLHHSFWVLGGRVLRDVEYMRCMGFPDDYRWPGTTARDFRGYLSRGVVPAVAAWVLETLQRNLDNRRGYLHVGKMRPRHDVLTVAPGGTADLRVKRAAALEAVAS